MAIELKKDIPEISYFKSGNIYIGSINKAPKLNETTFNYKITPQSENIEVEIWFGMYCIGLSTVEIKREFPLSEDGINQMISWINEESSK